MSAQGLREPLLNRSASTSSRVSKPHPGGRIRHGGPVQLLRMVAIASWFGLVVCTIGLTQYIGAPLYLVSKEYYNAFMAMTKQSFGLLITTFTQWFSPTVIRISGDRSVRGQLMKTKDGLLQTDFPERIVMIANHQVYTEWIYLWWIAYTNKMHGHVYIILKESIKYIPIIGPGMMFYGFIFMARNWTKDKPRLQHRLQKLKTRHTASTTRSQQLDPMWLILFPEGTNLSANTVKRSRKWAEQNKLPYLQHQLLPRNTGLQYCLEELADTVHWIYDCTIAYEGVPRGGYAQDFFTIRSTYFQGRPPKSVNMFWRRFEVCSIPVSDPKKFEIWLRDRWLEKEELIEGYIQNGRFPADDACEFDGEPITNRNHTTNVVQDAGYIETEVQLAHWYEIGQIFVVLGAFGLLANILVKVWNLIMYGDFAGKGLEGVSHEIFNDIL